MLCMGVAIGNFNMTPDELRHNILMVRRLVIPRQVWDPTDGQRQPERCLRHRKLDTHYVAVLGESWTRVLQRAWPSCGR